MRSLKPMMLLLTSALALVATNLSAVELLNVSYDPTRELYTQPNEKFIEEWKAKTGETPTLKQ